MKKVKAVGIAIILVLAIFATYMIFFRAADSDGDGVLDEEELRLGSDPSNPDDATKGTLIYDSSGENYESGTRGDPEETTNLAFIATPTSNGGYKTTPVLMDESIVDKPYMALSGIFRLDESEGAITVDKYIESDEEKLDLKTDSVSESYENVEVETNAIGLVLAEHTFGFCTDPTDPLVFISLDKKPAFFTDIILSGVMLPEEFLNETNILDIEILNDLTDFIDALNLNYNLSIKFILADQITYKNETRLKADVLDVITPDDISKLLKAIGGSTIPESSYKFISDALEYVDMELLVINELDNTINDFTLWFVVGITDLTREEVQGIVTLKISEVDPQLVATKLGIDIEEPSDSAFSIRYAVCGESDPYEPAKMKHQEVTDLWDALENNISGTTGIASVEVDTFALVIDLNTLITSLEGAFNTDMDFLSRMTTVRNPAVALIIDQNFTSCLDLKHTIIDYLAIGLFPDFQLEGSGFYLLNIKGVLYDTGIFIDFALAQVPLIVSDSLADGMSYAEKVSLEDIYETPEDNVEGQLITHIETDGFAMGTTMVTAASYLQYIDLTGITQMVAKSPIDIGLYDLSYTSSSDTHYHTGMVQFTVGKGPTYFGDHVDVHGFYFNLNQADEIMRDAFDLADGFGPMTLFTDLMDGILSLFGHRYLDGFILAYDIESDPLNYMRVDSLEVEDEIYNENGNSIYIEGELTNMGNTEILPRVKTVITSPSGIKYFDSGQIYYNGFWDWVPALFLAPGWEGSFRLSKLIVDPEIGVYEVDIYLVQFGEQFGFGKNLGYAHTNFTIWEGIEVTVSLTYFTMLDYIDSGLFSDDMLADPYFEIWIWGYGTTSGVLATDLQDGDISFSFSTKVFDYINEVEIAIIGWDDDWIDDDLLDLSAIGSHVDLTYYIDSNTWSGDTTSNVSSGEDDGSYDIDEDDARITFVVYDSEG